MTRKRIPHNKLNTTEWEQTFGMSEEQIRKHYRQFIGHKCGANARVDAQKNPITFKLTFPEWLKIWLDSGHLHERGVNKGQYVMSRVNDLGDYEVGNVFIQLHSSNARDGVLGKERSLAHSAAISKALQGRPFCGTPNVNGTKHTQETKAKLSKNASNRKRQYREDGSWYWIKRTGV